MNVLNPINFLGPAMGAFNNAYANSPTLGQFVKGTTALYVASSLILPDRLNFASWIIARLSAPIFSGISAGGTGGGIGGAASGIKQLVSELTDSFDVEKSGQKFGDKLVNFLTSTGLFDGEKSGLRAKELLGAFISGTKVKQGDIGAEIGKGLTKELEKFLLETGLDPVKFSGQISKLIQDMIANGNFEEIAEKINEKLRDAIESLNLRELSQQLTKDVGEAVKEGMRKIGTESLHIATFELLPYYIVGMAACVATPLGIHYLYQKAVHDIGRPKLATEVHQRTIFTPVMEQVKNFAPSFFSSKEKKPIFNATITRRIGEISKSTNNIRNNGGYFQNVLFYGPGGTGKTMISEYISKHSGMSYIKMSGGDLAQYIKRGEHVTELNKLLDKMNLPWRPWSSRRWILFIDEAESLCRDRSSIPTSELLELQNALLNRTGTESDKFMIILSTNRMEDLDEAILSRMDHKIFIGKPGKPERFQIIKSSIPQFFSQKEQDQFFTDPKIDKIAQETNGLTGRSLFKLLNAIANKKAATESQQLLQSVIEQTIKDMVHQEREIEMRRTLKEKNQPLTPGEPAFSKRHVSRPVR